MLADKNDTSIRLVTFNVNGIRTLFHYPPFSTFNNSLPQVFQLFNADIITFQELKIDKRTINRWGKNDNYLSFITIPTSTRGYSGVGCWVRIYPADHPLHNSLQILKAEEGITGLLTITNKRQTNGNIADGGKTCYRDDTDLGIGGYDGIDDICHLDTAREIDSQGRCVMLEFANNMVVISTYCPANSGRTQEGELSRVTFLKILFKRIRNLEKMGKNVVLMGDLNVCRDIFDSAESIEKNSINITSEISFNKFMQNHSQLAFDFVMNPETPHRRMLNQLLIDSNIPELAENGILVDSTRLIQTMDRFKLYTVWNTLKNARPLNYGSRVDFILVSNKLKNNITNADILPDIMGSDHCPLFTDIDIANENTPRATKTVIPRFEARYKYNLNNNNILTMFSKSFKNSTGQSNVSSESDEKNSKSTTPSNIYNTRKRPKIRTNSIDSFFKKCETSNNFATGNTTSSNNGVSLQPSEKKSHYSSIPAEKNPFEKKQQKKFSMKDIFGKPPNCKHNEETILKTSRTTENPGRKFWTCARSKGASNDKESSCGFFQWV